MKQPAEVDLLENTTPESPMVSNNPWKNATMLDTGDCEVLVSSKPDDSTQAGQERETG